MSQKLHKIEEELDLLYHDLHDLQMDRKMYEDAEDFFSAEFVGKEIDVVLKEIWALEKQLPRSAR